jgi:glycosidase
LPAKAPAWVSDAIFYEVFPDRFANGDPSNDPVGVVEWTAAPTRDNFFGGDLAGLIGKLDYLDNLGVNALYLTPIFKAGTNHRYDAHDYFRVDPALGDVDLVRELVRQAHARGMRVVLDGVFNHCGDGFWAFRDVLARGSSSPYYDWFFVDSVPISKDPPNYQACGGAPYLPKLNTDHPDVRRHLLDAAGYWLREAEIDGWRIDVPWEVSDEFWCELREVVKAANPDAYLVAEAWYEWWRLPEIFDGLMNYRLRKQLLDFCVLGVVDAQTLARGLEMLFAEALDAPAMLNLLGSHDTVRLLTRAAGDERRAILAFAALFTLPGAPMLYYGDELGMEGENDPDCRRAMVWDPALQRDSIQTAVRGLIELRRTVPALRRGSYVPVYAFNRVFAYARTAEAEQVTVVLNAGPARSELEIPTGNETKAMEVRDALTGWAFPVREGAVKIAQLPECSALILRS